jgi:hypothetical protein
MVIPSSFGNAPAAAPRRFRVTAPSQARFQFT